MMGNRKYSLSTSSSPKITSTIATPDENIQVYTIKRDAERRDDLPENHSKSKTIGGQDISIGEDMCTLPSSERKYKPQTRKSPELLEGTESEKVQNEVTDWNEKKHKLKETKGGMLSTIVGAMRKSPIVSCIRNEKSQRASEINDILGIDPSNPVCVNRYTFVEGKKETNFVNHTSVVMSNEEASNECRSVCDPKLKPISAASTIGDKALKSNKGEEIARAEQAPSFEDLMAIPHESDDCMTLFTQQELGEMFNTSVDSTTEDMALFTPKELKGNSDAPELLA